MLGGRDKIGSPSIDWKQSAFGRGKTPRKTIGFGKYDKRQRSFEFELELSIVDAGIGCALWDASIIFARWIYRNPDIFKDQIVLELGSGCGLPGILSALYAKQVYLTDYIDQLIDNLNYNVALNSGELSADGDSDFSKERQFIKDRTKICLLDWDKVDEFEPKELNEVQVDIIIGSELTYSTLSVKNLTKVICKYLKPNGVFYEVLSNDRDGVSLFLQLIEEIGFTYEAVPVDECYLGNYGTNQRSETYKFYTFRRIDCIHPTMR